jgi:hypothetical protein
MYPSITPLVRQAIKRRYELVPYTYSLALRSHLAAVPPQRWTGWGFEHDPVVWTRELLAGDTQYWFGDALLVAGVYEPGADAATVYLPRLTKPGSGAADPGFLNTHAPYQWLPSGRWHAVSATWHSSIPVLARCGAAVPVGKRRPTTCVAAPDPEFPGLERDDWRGVEIFPPPILAAARHHGRSSSPGSDAASVASSSSSSSAAGDAGSAPTTFVSTWLEDDGASSRAGAEMAAVRVAYSAVGTTMLDVKVLVTREGAWEPLWLAGGVDVIMPVGDERTVISIDAGRGVTDKGRDEKGRRVWGVHVEVKSGSIEIE